MEKLKKESLIKALSFCGLRDVPEEWDKENVYLRALALVSKTDGSQGYILVEKDEYGNDRVVKDFGAVCAIHEIVSVHPFFFLDARWLPEFKPKGKGKASADGKAERIAWLERNNIVMDGKSDIKALDKAILHVAMRKALEQHPLL